MNGLARSKDRSRSRKGRATSRRSSDCDSGGWASRPATATTSSVCNQDLLVELPGIPVPIPFQVNANISRAHRVAVPRSPRQRDRHEPWMVPQPQRRLRARVAGLDGRLPQVPRAAVPLPSGPRLHRPGLRRAVRARVGARSALRHHRAPAGRRRLHRSRLRRCDAGDPRRPACTDGPARRCWC